MPPHRPGSWRRKPLPPDWPKIRAAVLKRDGFACQWPLGARICGVAASEVDHVNNDGPDDLWNLRALCRKHHLSKSASEGGTGWAKVRKAMAAAKRRPPERHPGYR